MALKNLFNFMYDKKLILWLENVVYKLMLTLKISENNSIIRLKNFSIKKSPSKYL